MTVPSGVGDGEPASPLPDQSKREKWQRRQSRFSDSIRKILNVFKLGNRRGHDGSNIVPAVLICRVPDNSDDWTFDGHVLGRNNDLIPAVIAVDTQSDTDVISLELHARLHHTLKPCADHETIITIRGDPVRVPGKIETVEWRLMGGQKTFLSDFLVLDMDIAQVIIGKETIKRYRLITPSQDLLGQ